MSDNERLALSQLPHAFGLPQATGCIRACPEDFRVDEIPLVEPDGEGEHVLLDIEKRNSNTDWVAKQLARLADVPNRDVSYAGLKDRNAVTRQWFSVRLAGKPEPDWRSLDSDDLKVFGAQRHSRKLRTGALRGNRFLIRVRDLTGDLDALEAHLRHIQEEGVPNYFGEQRFGHDGGNLAAAQALFAGDRKRVDRRLRGIYISAARSLLFNQVLARRVEQGSWNRLLEGERVMLDGSASSFHAEQIDAPLLGRLQEMDVHPSGPLWGRGRSDVTAEAAEVEQRALAGFESWQQGLERCGAELGRRALRAPVRDMIWSKEGDQMTLGFVLPRGSYATAVLRECLDYRSGSSDLRDSST
jgi:tRNA pseudouridine13 synthase